MPEPSNSEKLRDTLKTLLASELGEHIYLVSDGSIAGRAPAIRLVPPQVPDNIKMAVTDGRGVECLIYQDPRVEYTSRVNWEYYEVALRQHNLNQPITTAKNLIGNLFSGVKNIRIQQGQIKGGVSLEQVNLEIPRFYNFDAPYVLEKMLKLLG